MKKVVVEVGVRDEKEKQKAMKAVSGISGIDSISMNMKEKKLTVIGDVDPIEIVNKLRKTWHAVIELVGPAKDPADEKKKGEGDKKDKDGGGDKEAEKKRKEAELQFAEFCKRYQNYYNPYMNQHYVMYSAEENPNSCVIS